MPDYNTKKIQKIRTLKNLKKFEAFNRVLCVVCVLPFLHSASCLGQEKKVPLVSKLGAVGFGITTVAALVTKTKEEKEMAELEKILKRLDNSHSLV